MDIYVYLRKLSPLSLVTQLAIDPDNQITELRDREAHVFPKYEVEFEKALAQKMPSVIVIFRWGDTRLPSLKADSFVNRLVAERYSNIFEIEKIDFIGNRCRFEVYRLRV